MAPRSIRFIKIPFPHWITSTKNWSKSHSLIMFLFCSETNNNFAFRRCEVIVRNVQRRSLVIITCRVWWKSLRSRTRGSRMKWRLTCRLILMKRKELSGKYQQTEIIYPLCTHCPGRSLCLLAKYCDWKYSATKFPVSKIFKNNIPVIYMGSRKLSIHLVYDRIFTVECTKYYAPSCALELLKCDWQFCDPVLIHSCKNILWWFLSKGQ